MFLQITEAMDNDQEIDPEPIPVIRWRRQRLIKVDGIWTRVGKLMRVVYNYI